MVTSHPQIVCGCLGLSNLRLAIRGTASCKNSQGLRIGTYSIVHFAIHGSVAVAVGAVNSLSILSMKSAIVLAVPGSAPIEIMNSIARGTDFASV